MPIKPKFITGKDKKIEISKRVFTDREDYIQYFKDALYKNRNDEQNLLVYYGVGGIGKSSLRKEITKLYNEQIIHASLDFALPEYRNEETALYYLRKVLKDNFKIQFPAFEIAYAVYWQKIHPQTPITNASMPLLDESGILTNMVSTLGNIPIVGLIPGITSTVYKGHQYFKQWWTKRGEQELYNLPELEAKEILERLPMFFASDLKDYLQKYNKPCVIFIDTYEALLEHSHNYGGFFANDEWIRELIAQLPEPLWIIFGREKLRWMEIEPDWENYIMQYQLDSLSLADSEKFLISCSIENKNIRDIILNTSKGVPYFMDLAVDTYFQVKQKTNREPEVNDFAKNQSDVLDRFLKYLDKTEIETLKLLSVPRHWDSNLFRSMINEFKTGYPNTGMKELCRFSFIIQNSDNSTYSLQSLMRNGLEAKLDLDLLNEVKIFLFNYYNKSLDEINSSTISQIQEKAFLEAFYMGKDSIDYVSFKDWLDNMFITFNNAGKWLILIEIYENLILKIKKEKEECSEDYISSLNILGELYINTGQYNRAFELHQTSVKILKSYCGEEHPHYLNALNNLGLDYRLKGCFAESIKIFENVLEKQKDINNSLYASALNNLANVYNETGNFEKAGILLEKAISIIKNIKGENDSEYARSINNLANLYSRLGKYTEAIPLHLQTIETFKKRFGEWHPKIAVSYNNLANVYGQTGEYEKACVLLEKAMDIREKSFGNNNPLYAASVHNLANVYAVQKQFTKAIELYKKAGEIIKNTLGENHSEYAQNLTNLANVFIETGNLTDAFNYYDIAVNIKKKVFGRDSFEYAGSVKNIADAYETCKDYKNAEEKYLIALEIFKKDDNQNSQKVNEILYLLKEMYLKTGEREKLNNLKKRIP
ncbi:MAG: tetratricopeptide repeat protein [Ignavibacteriae bacterium]|nr:MAG: tetratricopeptide repeat protein [Ignavibacteriota bacterium]